jgi:hypothetical protein
MIVLEPDAVRRLLDQIASAKTRYDCRFYVQIAWLPTVAFESTRFVKTGKEGVRRSDGMPSAEYRASNGCRLWLGCDGLVRED